MKWIKERFEEGSEFHVQRRSGVQLELSRSIAMAPNDPDSVIVMPLCGPPHHWTSLTGVTGEISWKWKSLVHKRQCGFLLAFTLGSLAQGKSAPCHEDAQTPLWRCPCAGELSPPDNSQHWLVSRVREPSQKWSAQLQPVLQWAAARADILTATSWENLPSKLLQTPHPQNLWNSRYLWVF